jgi:hypothetical protein
MSDGLYIVVDAILAIGGAARSATSDLQATLSAQANVNAGGTGTSGGISGGGGTSGKTGGKGASGPQRGANASLIDSLKALGGGRT